MTMKMERETTSSTDVPQVDARENYVFVGVDLFERESSLVVSIMRFTSSLHMREYRSSKEIGVSFVRIEVLKA